MNEQTSVMSYGRGHAFADKEEITSFTLHNGDLVRLAAENGGFIIELREGNSFAWLIDHDETTGFHEAMLATRRMAHENGGTPASPSIDSYEAGEELRSEGLNGYAVTFERSEDPDDRCWDVYAVRELDGKTTDVQSFEPEEYLLAINAYDELYFLIEAGTNPFE